MKTSQQMINYCIKNRINYHSEIEKLSKHFQLITNTLDSKEEVLVAFDCNGVKNRGGSLIRGGATAVAFTNKKIIYAQAGFMVDFVKTIGYESVTSISAKKGFAFGDIIIDSMNEYAIFTVDKFVADKIRDLTVGAIESYRNSKNTSGVQPNQSAADEIKKFKELLDAGIITQKEFDAKKKQLLGL